MFWSFRTASCSSRISRPCRALKTIKSNLNWISDAHEDQQKPVAQRAPPVRLDADYRLRYSGYTFLLARETRWRLRFVGNWGVARDSLSIRSICRQKLVSALDGLGVHHGHSGDARNFGASFLCRDYSCSIVISTLWQRCSSIEKGSYC